MTTFSTQTYQNEYLARDSSEVNAIVTVSCSGATVIPVPQERAEVIIVDVSGSMRHPREKLKAALAATKAAIDCLPDGTHFGLIAGGSVARRLYPTDGTLVMSTAVTRGEAKTCVASLDAMGGTAIGLWLMEAYHWFAAHPNAIRHALLLTDGRNEGETSDYLTAVLEKCRGAFQCDCRGVGTDWEVAELRAVSSALLGSVDIVARPEGLEADFRAVMRTALDRTIGDVKLRVRTPRGAVVSLVQQVSPSIEDFTHRGTRVDELTVEYPTGAWGNESRDYHLRIDVPPGAPGEEMLAGKVSLVLDGEAQAPSLIRALWTDDVALSTRINPLVASYTGQAELAEAIDQGLEARRAGDDKTATARLGRAAQLATETGNDNTLRLLAKVVEIADAATGTVRLRRDVEAADEMALDTRSTKTVRVRPA
jgi:von Willebrand factor type A C-terminal domain/von Willebrand factor type A domain